MADDETIRQARDAAADLHHGLRQEKARGDADALAHVLACAEAAGVPPDQRAAITGGFVQIAEDLLGGGRAKRRRRLRRGAGAEPSPELPRGVPDQPQLPPGRFGDGPS
jgi:hypothetical protein